MLTLNNNRIWAEMTSKYLVIEKPTSSSMSVPWDETKDELNIVVILTDRIGDAFNSIYFLSNLKRLYPSSKLTYIGHAFGDVQFLKRIIGQFVDEVLFLDTLSEEDFIALAPDVIFDLNPVSELFPYYPLDLGVRVGHHEKCEVRVPQAHYNMKANDHLNILRALGKDVEYSYEPITLPTPGDRHVFPVWPSRPYITLCYEATARSWMMSDELMDDLIEYLVGLQKWDIFILGSNINEHGYCYSGKSKRVYQCTGTLSLFQSICIIAGAEYAISVDTGMMHAASYLGKPLLSVFTCGDPGKNAAQGQRGANVLVRVRTDPPSPIWQKTDGLQTFMERQFLRLDHIVEGFEKLLKAEEVPLLDSVVENNNIATNMETDSLV